MSMITLLAMMGRPKFHAAAQFLRPIADDGGGFRREPSSGQRYDKIDEVVKDDDATYIWQVGFGGPEECDFELTNSGIIAPAPSQTVKAHFWQKDELGLGLTGGWYAWLYEGNPDTGVLIKTMFDNHPGPSNGVYEDLTSTLSQAEKNAVTDWNDLWLRIKSDFTVADNQWFLTQVYIEIEEV